MPRKGAHSTLKGPGVRLDITMLRDASAVGVLQRRVLVGVPLARLDEFLHALPVTLDPCVLLTVLRRELLGRLLHLALTTRRAPGLLLWREIGEGHVHVLGGVVR